ncbi:SixA phosphatase family protein [Sphingosinicella rhizophila]|uniref:Histidine phosphatase family protein n=1 Tax=Sphingosinicella rhizophila TaxID=3050082 RepID=A0ABU3Q7Z2_9SPHN|nr:histidine phosphatase family protein [Sphingosinicella sp. GR2756]MDT9599417.1 histidine phosphatase family protein [Sphingosinicella sp. GR2756]
MKILTLLRHAKSSWDDPVARDFDRPLNPRGRRAARTVGREICRQGLIYDLVLASPARRVIETLAEVSEACPMPAPTFDKRIYLASTATLIDIVKETADSVERLLLVGHNPGLESLAMAMAAADGGALRLELEQKYPTGTLAEIRFDIEHWAEVDEGIGTLVRFIRPRDLDPELGPDEDSF